MMSPAKPRRRLSTQIEGRFHRVGDQPEHERGEGDEDRDHQPHRVDRRRLPVALVQRPLEDLSGPAARQDERQNGDGDLDVPHCAPLPTSPGWLWTTGYCPQSLVASACDPQRARRAARLVERGRQRGVAGVGEHAPQLVGQHAASRQVVRQRVLGEPGDLRGFRPGRRRPADELRRGRTACSKRTRRSRGLGASGPRRRRAYARAHRSRFPHAPL